jgi:hypothetical protein
MAGELEAWTDFNVAIVGAAVALAGLVIVAASVNAVEIVKYRTLTSRLAAAIATLVLTVTVGGVELMPGVGRVALGIVVIVATVSASAFQFHAARVIEADTTPKSTDRFLKSAAGFLPLAAYLVGGVLLVVAVNGGLIAIGVGAILAIISGLLVAWVALVEVLR